MNGGLLTTNTDKNSMYCLHCHSITNSSECTRAMKQCKENIVTMEEAEGRLKSQLQLALSQVEFQSRSLVQLKIHLDNFNRGYLKCKNDIKAMSNELVAKIRDHEDRLLQELDTHLDIEYKKCGFANEDVSKKERNIIDLTEVCNMLLDLKENDFLERFKQNREKFNILKLDICGMDSTLLKPRTIEFTQVKCNTSFGTLNISEPLIERPFAVGRRSSLKISPNIVIPLARGINNNVVAFSPQRNLNKFQSQKSQLTRKYSLQVPVNNHSFPPIIESQKNLFHQRSSIPTTFEEDEITLNGDIDDECLEMMWYIKTEGPERGQINCPSDVAFLPDKTLVVSDRGNNRLQLFDLEGKTIKVVADKKIKPFRVNCTTKGNIIVTDSKESCVRIYDKKGHFHSNLGKKFFKTNHLFKEPCAVAYTADHFIVSDLETNEVIMYNHDGKIIKHLDLEFKKPFYIATSQDRILVSDNLDHCVKVFDAAGSYLFQCALPPNQGSDCITDYLQYPTGVCTDEQGNIYVADWGSHTVSLFNSEGEFDRHLLTKEDGLYQPAGIAVIDDYLAVSNYSDTNSSIIMYKLNF